jgi:hypothetical protein
MDGPTALHQDGPNPAAMHNGQFISNGAMMSGYNGVPPPPNYYNGPPMPANMQHRPDMPSTSNGPLQPLQFPQQNQAFPSPMDVPNGAFYGNGQMPPGMMYNGGPPPPGYFNGPMPPQMNGVPGTPNGYPPEYQQMPHRVPSAPGNQARASPFGQPPMNGSMTPTYVMPGQAKMPGMFMPGAGRSTPNGNSGFVFTTDMANQAASDVSQSKQGNIAQWHSQNFGAGVVNQTGGRKSVGARNSPSYSTTTAVSRKRKGSQAVSQFVVDI